MLGQGRLHPFRMIAAGLKGFALALVASGAVLTALAPSPATAQQAATIASEIGGGDCRATYRAFVVPEGQIATDFALQGLSAGADCTTGGALQETGFHLERGLGAKVFRYSGDAAGAQTGGGNLGTLELGSGRYLLVVNGGEGAMASLSFTLRDPNAPVEEADACPGTMNQLGLSEGDVVACRCEAGAAHGSVWGANPYTADSNLCTAALHAGAIGASGGVVELMASPGLASYDGTVSNGIETRSWGSYGTSMTVLNAASAPVEQHAACPGNMSGQDDPITCTCAPERVAAAASIWGTGTYTNDSDICVAARHAGVLPASGGTVMVAPVPDAGQYTGSTRNGVTSRDYGPWRGGFVFP